MFLGMLAEAYGKAAQPEEGLSALAEALAAMHTNQTRGIEAILHRLKGELLLQSIPRGLESTASDQHAVLSTHHTETVAEACLHQALDVARRQQAKMLELRAATSLSRLWQQQGKQGEARQLLTPIYGWFTEGFDTADLQDAKALLEMLGGAT
jgi:hypothetical protein